MTYEKETAKKIAELNALFLTLNDKGQDGALTILRSLEFAQSVMREQDAESEAEQTKPRTRERELVQQ